MFKKIIICFISLLTLSKISVVNQTKETISIKDNNIQKTIKNKQNYRQINDENDQTVFDDGLYGNDCEANDILDFVSPENRTEKRSIDASNDQYENNDTISAAKDISPSYDGTYTPTSYSKSLDATLHRNEWLWGLIKLEVDVDYYEFRVYGKAELTIELTNIPSGCDYDLELFKHNNYRYADEDDVSSIATSRNGSNYQEKISDFIFPGVYYIKVYSYNDSFNAQEKYHLSLSVNYKSENVSISDLRYNKGAGAALWVSDYDPFEIQAFTSSGKSEVGFISSSQFYSAYSFGNPMFHYIRGDGKVLHASLFIWDLEIRKQLYEIVKKTIEVLKTEIGSKERIRVGLDITSEIVGGVCVVTGIVMTIIPVAAVSSAISIAVGIVTSVSPYLLDCLFQTIMPTSKIDEANAYLSYLEVLAVALEYNSSTSNQEIIKIDSSYEITTESFPGIVHMNYDIDFTPTVQDRYLYDSDIIYSFSSDAKFNGTVYPLKDLDDIQKARLKNKNPIEDVNTGGDTELVLNHSVPNQLSKGEYHWYHFVAPETATYRFKTDSSIDTYGELFPNIVVGQSNEGLLSFDDDGDYTNGRNFSLKYDIFKGRKVYLRVRGFGWKSTGLYSISVEKDNNITPITETVNEAELGFNNEYVDNENRSNVSLESGFSFSVRRIRCGYINNQYLALSAKCKGAGRAYLQMDFTQDIAAFNLGIAIWSEEEYLNKQSSIVLETKSKDGMYRTFYQFNIATMSKNKDVLDLYNFAFPEETYGIRISVTTNQVNYEKNKGRIVLRDMSLIHLA